MLTLVFALLLSPADPAPAALPAATGLTATPSATSLPKLYGTVETAGDKLASIVMPGAPAARWVAEGERIGGFVLKSVARGKITLARKDGTTVDVFLEGAQPSAANDDQPAPFSRKWINSRANPMLHNPAELGMELTRNWAKMTKEQRDSVIDFYLKHGWRMVRIETYSGSTLSIEWENIFSAERLDAVRENRARFEAGLTESQRAQWNELNRPRPMMRISNPMTEEQQREMERIKAASDRFRKSLTPAQEAERASIEDFTKGKW